MSEARHLSDHLDDSEVNDWDFSKYKTEISRLSNVSTARALTPLFFDWLIIVATITVAVNVSHWFFDVLAFIVIAGRQHALLVLVHEATHFRLSKNRGLNDLMGTVFTAWPAFFCLHGYRENHSRHHQFLNTYNDPDWARKVDLPEWKFPKAAPELLKTLLQVALTGWWKILLLFYMFSGLGSKQTWKDSASRKRLLKKFIFYAVAGTLVGVLGLHWIVLQYWVLPFLLVFPVIERVRSVAEHFALSYDSIFTQTRNVICSWPEAALFGPHNIRYHLVHHLFPSVPQYNLPELHEILMEDSSYGQHSHTNDAYLCGGNKSLLMDLVKVPISKKTAEV